MTFWASIAWAVVAWLSVGAVICATFMPKLNAIFDAEEDDFRSIPNISNIIKDLRTFYFIVLIPMWPLVIRRLVRDLFRKKETEIGD